MDILQDEPEGPTFDASDGSRFIISGSDVLILTHGPEHAEKVRLYAIQEFVEWHTRTQMERRVTLNRDQILAKRLELARTTVNVPELGGDVTIRTLTLKEVREINKLQKASTESLSIYPRIVALGCVDENGQALFVGEDVKEIDNLPWAATDTIAVAILRFNKMAPEEKKKGEDEEEDGNENGVPKA